MKPKPTNYLMIKGKEYKVRYFYTTPEGALRAVLLTDELEGNHGDEYPVVATEKGVKEFSHE